METNWAGYIMNILDQIAKLVLLNILWLLFTLLGLVLFGIMPATAAVFLIIRRRMQDKEVKNIFREFWIIYKGSFLSSNLVGLIFILIGTFLYLDIKILFGSHSFIAKVILAFIFLLCILYVVTFVNFFPIYSRYKMSLLNYLKLSLVIGLSHPLATFLMTLWVFVVTLLSMRYTVLIPLLFLPLISIGINWISKKMLEKKELFTE